MCTAQNSSSKEREDRSKEKADTAVLELGEEMEVGAVVKG
jgi:hypothetical protein